MRRIEFDVAWEYTFPCDQSMRQTNFNRMPHTAWIPRFPSALNRIA